MKLKNMLVWFSFDPAFKKGFFFWVLLASLFLSVSANAQEIGIDVQDEPALKSPDSHSDSEEDFPF